MTKRSDTVAIVLCLASFLAVAIEAASANDGLASVGVLDTTSTEQSFLLPVDQLVHTVDEPSIVATRLYVSRDNGVTWEVAGTYPVARTELPVTVRNDGRYQFAARYFSSTGEPFPNRPPTSAVEVLVDSTPPEVTLSTTWSNDSTAAIEIKVRDLSVQVATISLSWVSADPLAARVEETLAPSDFRIENGMLVADVAVDVPPLFDVSFRATAYDTAGHKSVQSDTLSRHTRSPQSSRAAKPVVVSSAGVQQASTTAIQRVTHSWDATEPPVVNILTADVVEDRMRSRPAQSSGPGTTIENFPIASLAYPANEKAISSQPSSRHVTPVVTTVQSDVREFAAVQTGTPDTGRVSSEKQRLFEQLLQQQPHDDRLRDSYADLLIEEQQWKLAEQQLLRLRRIPAYTESAERRLVLCQGVVISRPSPERTAPQVHSPEHSADDIWNMGSPR